MRTSGVLMPIFSLPGKYGIGCLSKEAYAFVKFLKKAKQTYWQILPVGPTSYGDSPYQSFSTFAGNPYFISLETLIEEGLLKESECEAADLGSDETDIDYGKLYYNRYPLLRKAYERSKISKDKAFRKFVEKQSWWLDDYSRFMAIKDSYGGKSYQEWDEPLRVHDNKAIAKFSKEHKKDIIFYMWLQYEFFRQWKKFKKFANKNGISIIGDIPIYVAEDSADTWANPQLFQMDSDRRLTGAAGCPPDGFSATGQLWGNPLYAWDYHKKTGYEWWIRRVQSCLSMYDVIRIDHFRGFDEYYSIEAGAETAIDGQWVKGPGAGLFTAIEAKLGKINIIAEDLGFMTDTVRQMVKDTGYPNMKVLEFAFDVRDKKDDTAKPNDYLPLSYGKNCVVYTGTHDNETLMGFLKGISKAEKKEVKKYLGMKGADDEALVHGLIRAAMASTADWCIIPIQDYLALDNTARINTPSTLGENWRWRLKKDQLTKDVRKEMKALTQIYWR